MTNAAVLPKEWTKIAAGLKIEQADREWDKETEEGGLVAEAQSITYKQLESRQWPFQIEISSHFIPMNIWTTGAS